MNKIIDKKQEPEYSSLISNIGLLLEQGRKQAYQSINSILVKTYWEIGKQIIVYEQEGKEKAEYGSSLLNNLSKDLKLRYGKGFNIRNIYLMRKFYSSFENLQTVSAELSWSHFVELMEVDKPLARGFYEKQCLKENWGVPEKEQLEKELKRLLE